MQQSSTSESMSLPPSTDITNNIESVENNGSQQHDAHLWFTQMLPEGCCVGVCTTNPSSSATPILSDIIEDSPSLNSITFLHTDEYSWGKSNIASDSSRMSYYLGRTAIRLSINTLIRNKTLNEEIDQDLNSNSNNSFYSQLNDQIESTAIRKDYYGRPILPEIILGSISHKGNYAVGLSRFRSSDKELKDVDIDALQWREECLISDDDETSVNIEIDNDVSCSSSTTTSSVRGIGIDLEFIDIKRGKRIKKRVLTENEQKELGQLEAIGISKEEEVLLRFSLKESVYKAMHPTLCQYVGFKEAEITPHANGTAKVTLNLTSGAHEKLGIVVQTASWKKMGDYFLTSASV